jgi:signal transduction histidine kinase
LLNDILDLSKVEAGCMELEQIDFDLREVIDKTTEMMALRADEKGLELGCSVAPDVAVDLIGDPNRLRQVLLNLIGNAIKFTQQGEVVLRVIQDPDVSEPGPLRFIVSDTGIGIPADKLDTVFERFVQADSSTTRKYGGTGLGLSISKRLVELMGGRIWVNSKEGAGSTFSFTARFAPQAHPRIATRCRKSISPE